MDDTLKSMYSFYDVPKEIHMLNTLEEKLNKEGLSLDIIGFQPVTDLFIYHITPPYLIPFAHTGGAGIHFGFLTEFSEVQDLYDAPIVCVSPTNDPPIRYMARNITELCALSWLAYWRWWRWSAPSASPIPPLPTGYRSPLNFSAFSFWCPS